MAQFTLTWDNTSVLASPNATAQRVSYRKRLTGGAFITVGFSLPNDLATSVNTVDSPSGLEDNVVYEFKVEAICSTGGPTINDNGVQEIINFLCIAPVITEDSDSVDVVITTVGSDITKARFTLKKASDNTIVSGPTIVNKVGTTITLPTIIGLLPETSYYFLIDLYATVNSVDVISSNINFLGSSCGVYPFTTDADPVCSPVTSVTISSIEVL